MRPLRLAAAVAVAAAWLAAGPLLAHPDGPEPEAAQAAAADAPALPVSPARTTVASPPAPAPALGLPLKPSRHIAFETDEGTWMSLALAPDGRTLVFELLGDLYALDARAGGQARRLTAGMAFDSQPAFSRDGGLIAFVSDRSGNENLWVARPDGTGARQVSFLDDNTTFVSPAFAADGRSVFVSRFKPDVQTFELWRYPLDGAAPEVLVRTRPFEGARPDDYQSGLGAVASPDGRSVYYAARSGKTYKDDVTFPLWRIVRRDLASGREETVATAQGSAMRPALSPDGRFLSYVTRSDGKTGLRLRDLTTGEDRWLAWPVQPDDQEGTASRDLWPSYAFTPDGAALVVTTGGRFERIALADGARTPIPFKAQVALDLGPSLRRAIPDETGPVRARVIQAPKQSPDGRRLVFTAFARLWVMDLARGAEPRRLTAGDAPEYHPAWSPDGRSVVYVTWRAREGGQLWIAPADGRGAPRELTRVPGSFWSDPVFSPDGASVAVLRSSNAARMQPAMEFGPRQADVVLVPAAGGEGRVVASGLLGGGPQFAAGRLWLHQPDGLHALALDGSDDRRVVTVKGPGWYFAEGTARVDDLKVSPDGRWALAQIAQQLHLLAMPAPGAEAPVIELGQPSAPHRKLTSVGADFFDWADEGRTITWAVGSTFYRRPLASVRLDPPGLPRGGERPRPGEAGVEAFRAVVEQPRDIPRGAVVLRGATVLTMKGDEVIPDADVVVVDGRIAAVGRRGAVAVPAGAEIRDVSGKWIAPGFVDVHAHWAGARRGVLEEINPGFVANLAYGVTAGLDVSSLSIDVFPYTDLVEAGMAPGLRSYSTGTALFSFNGFASGQEAEDVVRRYREHYRTRNLKHYRTGNRRTRQWVVQAAEKVGMMATAEGALDLKLDLTQVMDGLSNEHALAPGPIYRDVAELFARSGASLSLTLGIWSGGPGALHHFIAANDPGLDPKVRRFFPQTYIDAKLSRRPWLAPREYRYPQTAADGRRILQAGGLVGIGSHSEIEGLAYHYELQAHAAGGWTPREILRAATIEGARVIGRQDLLGSLEPDKYADLVVLDRDPLEDIANTLSIRQVMKNGRLYDADTLDEVWPRSRPLPRRWFEDERPQDTRRQP